MIRVSRPVARTAIALVTGAALLGSTGNVALADDWSITYSKFGAGAGAKMSVLGSAKISKKVLQLTDTSGAAEAGAAWTLPSVDPAQSFSTDFTANLSGAPGCNADGLSFTVQSQGPDALGQYGEGIGYGGISPALSVELDDFQNAGDPDNNHVAIALNGDQMNPVATSQRLPFNLYGSGDFHVHITHEAKFDSGVPDPRVRVWVWQNGPMPTDPTTEATLTEPLGTILGNKPAYVGSPAARLRATKTPSCPTGRSGRCRPIRSSPTPRSI